MNFPQYDHDSGSGEGSFIFMSAVLYRSTSDPIDLHLGASTLFDGHDVGAQGAISKARRRATVEPLQVRKNMWELPATFFVDGRLVVRADIASELASVSTATFIQIAFAEPYNYPFDLARGSLRDDQPDPFGDYDVDEEDEIMDELAARFAVPPPDDEFFEVACDFAEDLPESDVVEATVHQHFEAAQAPIPLSLGEHGLVWHGGYICSRAVGDILLPTLHRPYVWITRETVPH